MKCVSTLNDGSLNRTILSETDVKIVNGKHVRRLNGQNEKVNEKNVSCRVVRTLDTKQVP